MPHLSSRLSSNRMVVALSLEEPTHRLGEEGWVTVLSVSVRSSLDRATASRASLATHPCPEGRSN